MSLLVYNDTMISIAKENKSWREGSRVVGIPSELHHKIFLMDICKDYGKLCGMKFSIYNGVQLKLYKFWLCPAMPMMGIRQRSHKSPHLSYYGDTVERFT